MRDGTQNIASWHALNGDGANDGCAKRNGWEYRMNRPLKIAVLGGDGFCGWPTALALSQAGHDTLIIDNLSRRLTEFTSLTPISSLDQRVQAWSTLTRKKLRFRCLDITDYEQLEQLLVQENFSVIVHFAEQRSAPYSMLSSEKRRATISHNLTATHNLLSALVANKLPAKIVHLGTMGVYGYDSTDPLPEGYLTVTDSRGTTREVVHPADPGSIYHLSKVMDHQLLQFYAKNWGLPIVELHQGIVWGTQTALTKSLPDLVNRVDYDGEFGTVVNRFLVQASVGHSLSVYGSGGQKRAFIHLEDAVSAIVWAAQSAEGEARRVRIFNQFTEVHSVADIASMIQEMTSVNWEHTPNPRRESEGNSLSFRSSIPALAGQVRRLLPEELASELVFLKQFSSQVEMSRFRTRADWFS